MVVFLGGSSASLVVAVVVAFLGRVGAMRDVAMGGHDSFSSRGSGIAHMWIWRPALRWVFPQGWAQWLWCLEWHW